MFIFSVLTVLLFSIIGVVLVIFGIKRNKKIYAFLGALVFCLIIAVGLFTGILVTFMDGFVDGITGNGQKISW